ncbi:hypothetical protein KSU1_C0004 [Candidatus Jettenia caeni]|uniref:Uncharacterized protein n=1 Tax=Candidatus Jettenia caeni TaxID=247490 RepID=I3IIQ5_9BACT|nr:hypothetical protein KSU1_C0004 [Candidatus Jettenia caeni]
MRGYCPKQSPGHFKRDCFGKKPLAMANTLKPIVVNYPDSVPGMGREFFELMKSSCF